MNAKVRPILLILGTILFAATVYMAFNFIGAIALGIFIYYCTRPIYRFLKSKDINPTISALVAQLTFIVPTVLLLAYTIQIISFEIRSFVSDTSGILSEIIEGQDIISRILEGEEFFGFQINQGIAGQPGSNINGPQDLLEQINSDTIDSVINIIGEIISQLVSSVSGLFFTLFIAFALSFYLQRDSEKLKSFVTGLMDYDRDIQEYLNKLDSDLKVVFLGNIALALGTAIVGATSFYLITLIIPGGEILKYPGLIGFLCGIASLIPVVGMKLVYFPVSVTLILVSLIQKPLPDALLFPLIFFVVALVIVDTIPDLIARPYLGSLSGISTSVLLFSYIFGPLAFGWYGLFLGPIIFVSLYEFIIVLLPSLLKEYKYLRK